MTAIMLTMMVEGMVKVMPVMLAMMARVATMVMMAIMVTNCGGKL